MTTLAFDAVHDASRRRRLLWAMPAGLYVLGSTGGADGPYNLMTHSLAVQAAVEPCVVALAVEVAARTHALVEASGVATLSVLRRDQRAVVRRFVKPVEDVTRDDAGRVVALSGVAVGLAPSGAPHLADAAGCLDLRVVQVVRFESHSLFCCEVAGVAVSDEVLEGSASARLAEILRMQDTKMSYRGLGVPAAQARDSAGGGRRSTRRVKMPSSSVALASASIAKSWKSSAACRAKACRSGPSTGGRPRRRRQPHARRSARASRRGRTRRPRRQCRTTSAPCTASRCGTGRTVRHGVATAPPREVTRTVNWCAVVGVRRSRALPPVRVSGVGGKESL